MRSWGPTAILAIAALTSSAPTEAATRPSARACLVAWNGPANAAHRAVVAARRPWPTVTMEAGVTFTVRWTRGGESSRTRSPACLLTLAKTERIRVETGIWRNGRVVTWRGSEHASPRSPRTSNVRLLADGRVTKLYRP